MGIGYPLILIIPIHRTGTVEDNHSRACWPVPEDDCVFLVTQWIVIWSVFSFTYNGRYSINVKKFFYARPTASLRDHVRLYRILTVGWEAIRSIDGLVVQLSPVTPYTRVRFPVDAMDCIFLVSFHFLTRITIVKQAWDVFRSIDGLVVEL